MPPVWDHCCVFSMLRLFLIDVRGAERPQTLDLRESMRSAVFSILCLTVPASDRRVARIDPSVMENLLP